MCFPKITLEYFKTHLTPENAFFLKNPCVSDGKESACNAGDSVQSLGQEDPLKKGTATHSRILAWRILGIEELGRL